MTPLQTATKPFLAPCTALALIAACSGGAGAGDSSGCPAGGACTAPDGGGDDSGSSSGSGSGGGSGSGASSGSGSGGDAGGTVDTGAGSSSGGGGIDSGGVSDANLAYDAVGSADVVWGQPCLYNFGSSCPFPFPQECGNHQAIDVSFPNGPQLLNATLFAGVDCGTGAQQDNFNDQQNTLASMLWMFTDDAAVPGVTPSTPTSVIWWVGPLTADGYPPAGAPTTGCINYTSAMAMCP